MKYSNCCFHCQMNVIFMKRSRFCQLYCHSTLIFILQNYKDQVKNCQRVISILANLLQTSKPLKNFIIINFSSGNQLLIKYNFASQIFPQETCNLSQMMNQQMIRNAKPFSMQQLKLIKGSIPKSIVGSYIKNGPGLFTLGDQILPHWFMGDAGLLKIQFHEGNAYAMYKMVETPAYKRDLAQKNFNRQNPIIGMMKNLVGLNGSIDDIHNSASTSVLRLPNSDKFYALYEGGLPFGIEQKSMKQLGSNNLGFIKKGFSAHPKIDPDNGNIFNIGFNTQSFEAYRMTNDFKLIVKNTINLRVPQSLHDCCLAGDYLVVFQCPVKLDMWKLIKGHFAVKCYSADYNYGKTIVYILKKQNLQLVRKIQLASPETFFMFHFTNGYVENNKLFVEYVKYPGQNAQKILDLVDYAPNYAVKNGDKKHFSLFTQLETLEINLQDFSYKFNTNNFDCEFPLCEDHEVGKKWQYSYIVAKQKGAEFFNMDRLIRYDRINDKTLQRNYPGCCIVEPSLIRTDEGLFILVLKTDSQRCILEILDGENLKTIAQIELPEIIPFGFHGKWLGMNDKKYLETGEL